MVTEFFKALVVVVDAISYAGRRITRMETVERRGVAAIASIVRAILKLLQTFSDKPAANDESKEIKA